VHQPDLPRSLRRAGCTLSVARFTHEAVLGAIDLDDNRVSFVGGPLAAHMREGSVRWLDGPHAGVSMEVVGADAGGLVLDIALDPALAAGTRALLREGCDHTLQTCTDRFANATNFQGEPFVPGNDLIARYPSPSR
jgi:uncharacterized phage protein (TIGR02218 family)